VVLSSDAPTATVQVWRVGGCSSSSGSARERRAPRDVCDAEIAFVPEPAKRYVLEHHSTMPRCEVVVASDSIDVPPSTFDRATCATANAGSGGALASPRCTARW
jgi:hypothetical protein